MLPYLKIKIRLAGEPGTNEDKEVEARIQPDQISAYHPGFYWGTFIYLTNNQVLCTRIECDELERMITRYWAQVGKKSRNLLTLNQ